MARTLGNYKTNVKRWLFNRPDCTPDLVKQFVNDVMYNLAIPFRFHAFESTQDINVVSGTASYALGSTLYAVESVRDVYNKMLLNPMTPELYDEVYDVDASLASPENYMLYGSNITLWPTPDFTSTGGIRLRGIKLPTPLADDADEPEFPEDWHYTIELVAAADMAALFGMNERHMFLKNMALGQIDGKLEAHTIERRNNPVQFVPEKTRPINSRLLLADYD